MLIKSLKKLRKSETGATAIEYGLIAALVAVAVIGALSGVGSQLDVTYTSAKDGLAAANATP